MPMVTTYILLDRCLIMNLQKTAAIAESIVLTGMSILHKFLMLRCKKRRQHLHWTISISWISQKMCLVRSIMILLAIYYISVIKFCFQINLLGLTLMIYSAVT